MFAKGVGGATASKMTRMATVYDDFDLSPIGCVGRKVSARDTLRGYATNGQP